MQEFDPLEDEVGIQLQDQIINFIKQNTDESGSDLQPSALYSRETEAKMVDETERRSRFKMFTDSGITETTNSESKTGTSGSDVDAEVSEAPDNDNIISEHVIASADGAEAVEESDNSKETPDQEPPKKNAGDSKTNASPSRSKILDLVEAYVNHLNVTGISKTGYKYIFLRKDVTYIRYSQGDFFNRHEDYLSLTTNCVEEYTGLMCVGASEDLIGGETAFSVGVGFTVGRKGKQNTAVSETQTANSNTESGERRPKGEVLSGATTTPRCAVFFRKDIPHEGTKVIRGIKEVIMFDLFAVQTAIAPSIRLNQNLQNQFQSQVMTQTYPAVVAIGVNIPETISLRDLLIGNKPQTVIQGRKIYNTAEISDHYHYSYSSNYIVVPCSGVLNTSLRLRKLIEEYQAERVQLLAAENLLKFNSSESDSSGTGTTSKNSSSRHGVGPSLSTSLMHGVNQAVAAGLAFFGSYAGNAEDSEVGSANVWHTREKDFDVSIDRTKSTGADLIFINIHGFKGNYLPVYNQPVNQPVNPVNPMQTVTKRSHGVSKTSKSTLKENQAKITPLLRKLERVFHRSYLSFEDFHRNDFKEVLRHLGIPHFNVLVEPGNDNPDPNAKPSDASESKSPESKSPESKRLSLREAVEVQRGISYVQTYYSGGESNTKVVRTVHSTVGLVQADESSTRMFGPVNATVTRSETVTTNLHNDNDNHIEPVPTVGSTQTTGSNTTVKELTLSNFGSKGPNVNEKGGSNDVTSAATKTHTSTSATVESRLRNESYPVTSRLNLSTFGKNLNRNDILLLETPEKTEFVAQVVRENRLSLLSFHVIFAEGFHSISGDTDNPGGRLTEMVPVFSGFSDAYHPMHD